MADFIGMTLGIIIGIGIGLYFGMISKSQKPWSELTKKEKKRILIFLIIGCIAFFLGIVTYFLF